MKKLGKRKRGEKIKKLQKRLLTFFLFGRKFILVYAYLNVQIIYSRDET